MQSSSHYYPHSTLPPHASTSHSQLSNSYTHQNSFASTSTSDPYASHSHSHSVGQPGFFDQNYAQSQPQHGGSGTSQNSTLGFQDTGYDSVRGGQGVREDNQSLYHQYETPQGEYQELSGGDGLEEEEEEEGVVLDREDGDYEPGRMAKGKNKRSATASGTSTPNGAGGGRGKRQKSNNSSLNSAGGGGGGGKGKKVATSVDQFIEYEVEGGNESGGTGGNQDQLVAATTGGGESESIGAGQVLEQGLAADEAEPLYVNAKQYHRILKRRSARARLEEMGRLSRERKVSFFLHSVFSVLS